MQIRICLQDLFLTSSMCLMIKVALRFRQHSGWYLTAEDQLMGLHHRPVIFLENITNSIY